MDWHAQRTRGRTPEPSCNMPRSSVSKVRLGAHRHIFWGRHFEGERGSRSAFWESLNGHPIAVRRPTLREEELDGCIPLGLRADGAPMTKREGLFALSWNSLLASDGSTMQARCAFTCARKSDIGPGAIDAI
eukprot:7803669-Pyramimonas_sp.AAC.1